MSMVMPVDNKTQRRDLIVALFNAGNSMGRISRVASEQLDVFISRSAVAGIIKRARGIDGLVTRDVSVQHAENMKVKKTYHRAEPSFAPPPEAAPSPPPDRTVAFADPVSIADLKDHHCRAVVGDTLWRGHKVAMHCGAKRVSNSPYCEGHTAQFTPASAQFRRPAGQPYFPRVR